MNETYDIVVIGGGIHGVGVGQAAAASGLTVCVLEKSNGLAYGTSSRSSKLIHGGLRYLETGQLPLVYECLRERRYLLKNAPGLVKLQPFFIPIYDNSSRNPLMIRLGLTLYALLGKLTADTRFRKLKKNEWDSIPGLKHEGLQAIFQFYDGQTDDAALTRAVMQSAEGLGAKLHLNAEVQNIEIDSNGCSMAYLKNGEKNHCHAKVIVNAAGPWAHKVAAGITPQQSTPEIELVAGTHIVLQKLPIPGIIYAESPVDNRPIFIMPWKGHTLVGTTERRYHGNPDDIKPSAEEIDYLLKSVAHYFPAQTQLREQLKASFAGCRVLPASEGNANRKPRETSLIMDDPKRPKILSIYGGKLTAYRATAEQVMKKLSPVFGTSCRARTTRNIALRNKDSITSRL
ncbi:MAG: hypothetical protein DSZ28_02925 [Thiothrix sp.]|nr:MAG: hypothetical protein DSZ28_02925 [Thiothrix sp.]